MKTGFQILKAANDRREYLISPWEMKQVAKANKLVEAKLMRHIPNFSLANFWVYSITLKGKKLLQILE